MSDWETDDVTCPWCLRDDFEVLYKANNEIIGCDKCITEKTFYFDRDNNMVATEDDIDVLDIWDYRVILREADRDRQDEERSMNYYVNSEI